MAFKRRVVRKLKRRPTVARKRKTVSVAVKKYVKSTISKNIENKCFQVNGGYSFGNINEDNILNAYPMCPLNLYWTIPQGITQGGRIGNEVRVKKVMLNYILRPNFYDVASNPLPQPSEVQLMLGYFKETPSALPTSTQIGTIFQSGSSSVPPVGTLRDHISVINKDTFHCAKRWTHKIGLAEYAGTGGNASAQFNSNNDFKLNVKKVLNITKYCPKLLRFNDGGSTTLTKNLFLLKNAVAAGGGVYSASNLPVNIEFWIDFHYEDA